MNSRASLPRLFRHCWRALLPGALLLGALLGTLHSNTALAAPPDQAIRSKPSELQAPITLGLFIGSGAYHGKEKLTPLEYADDDVLRFVRAMRPLLDLDRTLILLEPDAGVAEQLESGDFPPWQVPTRVAVLDGVLMLERWTQEIREEQPGRDVRVMLFLSAHGDSHGVHLSDGVLSGGALQAQLQSLSADSVVLLADSCFSDYWLGLKGAAPTADSRDGKAKTVPPKVTFSLDAVASAVRDLERVGAVTARSYTREERTLVRGGLVTHILSSALLGPADLNQDGKILYDELQAFLDVYARNSGMIEGVRVRAPRKTPQQPPTLVDLRTLEQRGLLFVPSSRQESNRGRTRATAECYWVKRVSEAQEKQGSGGTLIAEFCRQPQELRKLYLPAGNYRIIQRFLPDSGWGNEGVVSVGNGFSPVQVSSLTNHWMAMVRKGGEGESSDGPDSGLAQTDAQSLQPPADARMMSDEETGYLSSTPFRRVVGVESLPDGKQLSFRLNSNLPLSPIAAAGRETAEDSFTSPAVAFTQEAPAYGTTFGYDRWLFAVGPGYFSVGGELGFAASPNTRVGNAENVVIGMMTTRARVGWVLPVRRVELKTFAWAGTLTARTMGSTGTATEIEPTPLEQPVVLPVAPRVGVELELGFPLPAGRHMLISVAPQSVWEPHQSGEGVLWVPWAGIQSTVGLRW